MSRTSIAGVAAAVVLSLCGNGASVSAQGSEPDYQDDRSTPETVLSSLSNAINRHEYARAWSYWEDAPPDVSFDAFQQGYAGTASVQLSTGGTQTGVGLGQIYYSTPVTLVATMNDGSIQTFVGCYVVHIPRPAFQINPPYQSMGIQRAMLRQVDNEADTAGLMVQACPPA
jgi:hypothetical protein